MELCDKCAPKIATEIYTSLSDSEVIILYYLYRRKHNLKSKGLQCKEESSVLNFLNTIKKISESTNISEFKVRVILRAFEIIQLVYSKKVDHSYAYFITDFGETIFNKCSENEKERIIDKLRTAQRKNNGSKNKEE